MSNLTIKQLTSSEGVKKKFQELLGKRAPQFLASVSQIATSNKLLAKADPNTVLNAAATAAFLNLTINQNLGYAWVVPYGRSAQFQLGYRGYIQLAQRTGEYERINAIAVYENQFRKYNALTEFLDADFDIEGEGKVVGYVAYFKLLNGQKKTIYKSRKQIEAHAKRFSKTFNNGPWKTDFDKMAIKTVLKELIRDWGPTSIEMQTAIAADQSIQRKEGVYDYDDNGTSAEVIDEERERIKGFVAECETKEDLEQAEGFIQEGDAEMIDLFNAKKKEINV